MISYLRAIFVIAIANQQCLAQGRSNVFSTKKPNKLSMLNLVPITGKEPSDGKACIAAAEIVMEAANSRVDILSEYELEMFVKDEGLTAWQSPKQFIRFLREFEERNEHNAYIAPVVVGPSIACQSVAFTLRINHFSEFAEGCTGPYLLLMRRYYSSLYRTQMPYENVGMAIILFAQKVGKWQQLGIITYNPNNNDNMLGQSINRRLVEHGLTVSFYTSDPDLNEQIVQSILISDTRIIILAHAQLHLTIRFMCLGHAAGFRSPNFVIISTFYTYFNADSPTLVLPKGCTREMIYEQMKITFWAGSWLEAVQNNGMTPMGYDLPWFEQRMLEKLNGVPVPDWPQRHLCHDAAMLAVLTMNTSEAILQQRYNMSLKDFQQHPKLVGGVINSSAGAIDYNGLRIGRLKYSERLELDNEDMWILQWVNGTLFYNYRVTRTDDNMKTVFNISFYKLIPVQPALWFTKSGNPPKDLSGVVHLSYQFPPVTAIAIISVSIAVILGLVAIAVRLHRISLTKANFVQLFNPIVNVLTLSGFILMSIASLMLMLEISFAEQVLCFMRPLCTTLGVSFANSALFLRACLLRTIGKTSYAVSKNNRGSTATERGRSLIRNGNLTAIFIFLSYLTVALVWIFADSFSTKRLRSKTTFDETLDSHFDVEWLSCRSKQENVWYAVLVGINGFTLAAAYFFAYDSQKQKMPKTFHAYECRNLRLALLNAITIFLGILLIIAVVSGTGYLQVVVVAVGNLVYAVTIATILYFPVWTNKWPDLQVEMTRANTSARFSSMNRLNRILNTMLDRRDILNL